jgi:hypothetical protein
MRAKRLDFKALGGCNFKDGRAIESAVIREVTVSEQETANELARAKGGGASDEAENIASSLVEVNGKPVSQPYGEIGDWNARAAGFLGAAYNALNGSKQAERDLFLSAAVDLDIPLRQTTMQPQKRAAEESDD